MSQSEYITLAMYTKKRMLEYNEHEDFSDKRHFAWIKMLKSLFGFSEDGTLYNDNTTLCILAELVAHYMEHPKYDTSSVYKLMDDIANYPPTTDREKLRSIDYTQRDIEKFFNHFICYNNIWENYNYKDKEEQNDILSYMEKYIRTYTIWTVYRKEYPPKYNLDEQVKQYFLALYYRNLLPDIEIYLDEFIDTCTSFKYKRKKLIE